MWFLVDSNSRRRFVDAAGLALFHQGALAVFAWSVFKMDSVMNFAALAVLAIDVLLFFIPRKRKPILDPKSPRPEPRDPDTFTLEAFLLIGPPAALLCWFLALIWNHRTLTHDQLLGLVIGMPIVVGLISWAIYIRMTRYHVGIKSHKTSTVAVSMLATWVFSTFFFVVFVVCMLAKR